jgi:hypothetical protein
VARVGLGAERGMEVKYDQGLIGGRGMEGFSECMQVAALAGGG